MESIAAEIAPWHHNGELPTPGALILDDVSAVTLAVCGHWWQAPVVTALLAAQEHRPVLWAPIGTCGPCQERVRLLEALDRIAQLATDPRLPADLGLEFGRIATGAIVQADPLERGDPAARAVVVLESWTEGATNPRTRGMARCVRQLGCPYALGHPGSCEAGRGAPAGPSVAILDGRTADLVHAVAVESTDAYVDQSATELVELVELDATDDLRSPHVD